VLATSRHLDMYGHVNNAEYVAMAVAYVPDALDICQVQIEYRKAAVLGDLLYPKSAMEGNNFYLALVDEQDTPYACFVFSGRI